MKREFLVSCLVLLFSIATKTHANPVLQFATYLGGAGEDSGRDVAVDAQGYVYVAGGTGSANFPTTRLAFDRTFNGWHDVIVQKYDPNGTLVFSTFLGGPNYDRAYAIEVDQNGFIYIAGRAGDGFPTTVGALQPAFAGDAHPSSLYGEEDGFVAKLSPTGQLVCSTYFGSAAGGDAPRDMAIDPQGDIYVAMGVGPYSFPYITNDSFGPLPHGGTDLVVAKISADCHQLIWGGYLGGSGSDAATPSIRIGPGPQYDVYVLASTQSVDLPVLHAYQPFHAGGVDLFVARIFSDGSHLKYLTYFGGPGTEFTETHGLSVDATGAAYIAATTTSVGGFPYYVPGSVTPYQSFYGGSGGTGTGAGTNYPGDGFIAKLSPSGLRLKGFTYVGGNRGEGIEGVAVDASGKVYVSGATYSQNLPLTSDALQTFLHGGADGFLAVFTANLSQLVYATYVGGSATDYARTVAVSSTGKVYLAGMVDSVDLQTQSASDPSFNGMTDGFLVGITF